MTNHDTRPVIGFCVALIFGLSAPTAFGDDDDVPGPPPPCVFTVCNGTAEGEPCDDSGAPDTINGGCNNTPAMFGSVDCGGTICGTAWALGGNRDTDWYEVNLATRENVSLSVTAEAALTIVTLSGISNGICGTVEASQSLTLDPCVEGSVIATYEPGDAYLWIGHSDFDTLPCGGEKPGNDYIMTVTCSFPPIPPCCDLGDANIDGEVGFADLVIVLDNWGPCPKAPCCDSGDSNKDGEVDFQDLIRLLDNWGYCGF